MPQSSSEPLRADEHIRKHLAGSCALLAKGLGGSQAGSQGHDPKLHMLPPQRLQPGIVSLNPTQGCLLVAQHCVRGTALVTARHQGPGPPEVWKQGLYPA